jgi:myo-inositol-1(or 4)-monophosphatase
MTPSDVDVAQAAALAGAAVVRRDFAGVHVRTMKSATDVTTRTDVDAEREIMSVLSGWRPDDAVRGEETGDAGAIGAPRRWLVDPLCGTANFAVDTPLVAVNVALTEADVVTASAVADPVSDELFWADGAGSFAHRRGRRIPVAPTAVSRLIEVNCDGPRRQAFVGGQLLDDGRLRRSFSPRVISSTLALAWTAVGRRAAYVSDGWFRDNVHDSAGIAVCESAGCTVTDLAGGPLHAGRGLVVSADDATHEDVLAIVAPYLATVLGSRDVGSARG